MFAQFGDIQFLNFYAPTSMDGTENADWAEHALINTKPVLQHTGDALRTLNMNISLRQDFCKVKEEYAKFQQYKVDGTACPLVLGDGTVMGNFVIKTMSVAYQELEPVTGAYIQLDLQVGLTEFFVRDPLKQKQNEEKKKAVANKSTKKKVVKKTGRTNPSPCNTTVAHQVSVIQANLAFIKGYIEGRNPKGYHVLACCETAQKNTANIMEAYFDTSATCVYGKQNIFNTSNALLKCLDELHAALKTDVYQPYTAVASYNAKNKYNACVVPFRNLKTACSAQINASITKNG